MKAIYPNPETAGTQFDVNFPNTWIRLKRSGDVFESYMSSDNKTWKLFSTLKTRSRITHAKALQSRSQSRSQDQVCSFPIYGEDAREYDGA